MLKVILFWSAILFIGYLLGNLTGIWGALATLAVGWIVVDEIGRHAKRQQ